MPSLPTHAARYELLPTADIADDSDKPYNATAWAREHRSARVKQVLFRVVAVACVMFIGYQGLSAFLRSSSKFLRTKPCHGIPHRNFSALPVQSHYTLPSGDKIPTVALGMADIPRRVRC